MRFRSVLLSYTLFFAVFGAHADDASKTAKVEELFKVAHIDQLSTQVMQQTFDQINSGMTQQMMGIKLTPEQQKRADEFSTKVQKLIADGLGWKNLEPGYAKLYEATYTENEIDGILAFYKSPSGQAMVEKSPSNAGEAIQRHCAGTDAGNHAATATAHERVHDAGSDA
jgi:hypothetical protein